MNNAPIRLILVDDHKVVRESWKMMLENNPQFEVIAVYENGQTAIEEVQKHIPDVMLVDVNMSPLNGFDVTQRTMEINSSIKIIGISISNQPMFAQRMLALGATGYLTKTSPLEEIYHCIHEVHNGRRYICEEIKKNMPPDKKINKE
jgi:DNA-binding NarL/FixJ family response regulator